MNPTLVKAIKTVLLAGIGAAIQSIIANAPQIAAVLPPKWAGIGTVFVLLAAMYHKQPPSGDSGGGKAAAGLAVLVAMVAAFGWSGRIAQAVDGRRLICHSGNDLLVCKTPVVLASNGSDDDSDRYARVITVSWNAYPAHKLTWTVAYGHPDPDGTWLTTRTEAYEIDPDKARMSHSFDVASSGREIDPDEAAGLHHLLDTLTEYVAASTEWWKAGKFAVSRPPSPVMTCVDPCAVSWFTAGSHVEKVY